MSIGQGQCRDSSLFQSQLPHTPTPFRAQGQPLAMAHQTREDPTDTHLGCKREPGWHMFLSQVPALPHPFPHHQHVMSGRRTAGLSPDAEPLAHNPSQSMGTLISVPSVEQGGSKRSKSLTSWSVCYWDSPIGFQERSILCIPLVAFPKTLQTATTAPATGPPRQKQPQIKQ